MVEQPAPRRPWTIFLSHSSKDKRFVDWLYTKLRSADLAVWYDRNEILLGDSITRKIAEGLDGSELLIVVMSQQAATSPWVQAELEPIIRAQVETEQASILPIVLGNTDLGKLPLLLRDRRSIRFPHKGSDETFRELLMNIEGHLARRNLLQERRLSYEPLTSPPRQNPFGLRGGIDPERFVVPAGMIRAIAEDLVKKQSVSLVGPRMIGKTSLLKFLASAQCRVYYQDENGQSPGLSFAYLDLQEHSGKSRDQLACEIARVISETLPRKQRFPGSTHAQAMDWIKQTAGRRGVSSPLWVLLFDEFDRVTELHGVDKTFFDELRALPQHYNVCLVIASRRKIIDLPLPPSMSTSPFFNFLKDHFLSVWDASTAHTLMFKPRGTELQIFTADDFAFVTRLTAFHPLLLQISCYVLFHARHIGGKQPLDYSQVHDTYMQEAESIYRYYWHHEISVVEQQWLHDCQQVLADAIALQELQHDTPQRRNRAIRVRLAKLGLVLSESGTIELPSGVQSFLRTI